ncbi:hypothetical protein RND81_08G219500 [Saponaria officinalis]|uniref:Seed maturation-like protein n=1 Tax=Saponaria officinalis TaxID=3572 RepID=A0AAW1JB43_SAPOF
MASSSTKTLILSLKPSQIPLHHNHNHHHRDGHRNLILPILPHPRRAPAVSAAVLRRRASVVAVLGGGGLSDIRKSEFSREFAVIATMLKRIEPLDTAVISKGVSECAKDSMKQTISTMLGLIPSDQFSVFIRVSKLPLHRLLVSSIITGYTLWNAEYRVSLMRNFEMSLDSSKARSLSEEGEECEVGCESKECGGGVACSEIGVDNPKHITSDSLKGLSPDALSYIQQLEAELCSVKQELDAQKKDSKEMERNRGDDNNNLLEYLRSLESYMVVELSQPSSVEVKEVIFELVQNTIKTVFKDDATSEPIESTTVGSIAEQQVGRSETFTISRDYLAKLLFWCMMLGHHLRGLENRLHLSCVVGLL